MYWKQSRKLRPFQKLCSISNTTPSYFEVLMDSAELISAGENAVKVGFPCSSARITPFRRGRSAMLRCLLNADAPANAGGPTLDDPPVRRKAGQNSVPTRT